MEGDRADLEQQSDTHQRGSENCDGSVSCPDRHSVADGSELEGARIAVQQSCAEQEERRRERAQKKVLHRRFLREEAAPSRQTAQQVQREREDFEGNEHCQQVVRCRKQQQAAQREHRQREHLGLRRARFCGLPFREAPGHRRGLRGKRICVDAGIGVYAPECAFSDEQQGG